MIVSLIVAVAQNNVIGKDNDLIWHLPRDMAFFKETTTGHCIITGRRNYESIPERFRPLKNRTNIVLTRQNNYKAEGAIVVGSLKDGLLKAKETGEKECFIIGGGQVYKEALESGIVDRMYITHVLESFEGDTFFPEIDMNEWDTETLFTHLKDDKNPHDFIVKLYTKK